MNKISVLISLGFDSASTLMSTGELTQYDSFTNIPASFKEVVREFMGENVGYATGPIFCLSCLNGDPVTLNKDRIYEGDIRITDIMPTKPEDVLLEFAVKNDSVVTIGMMKLFELTQQAEEFGPDNEIVLDNLRSSLSVGNEVTEDNVFCFLSKLTRTDCIRYVFIDEDWKTSYRSIFRGVEESKVTSLSIF